MAFGSMVLAFAIGFILALLKTGSFNILSRFAFRWQMLHGLIYLAGWMPAILLAASALAFEGNEGHGGFVAEARKTLLPALVIAGLVSLFYLLLLPGIRDRKTWYERSSQLFHTSLADAKYYLGSGRLEEAEKSLLVCRAIDEHDSRFEMLWDQMQEAYIKVAGQLPESIPITQEEDDSIWRSANRFYLEALEAKKADRLFDAHYLAKRSYALYPNRAEVARLVEESWEDLQRLGPSAEEEARTALYYRKLEAYSKIQEGDYLGAYRILVELKAIAPEDPDISNYLKISQENLEKLAFFIDELDRAFRRSSFGALSLHTGDEDGVWDFYAEDCAISSDGVFFRNLILIKKAGETTEIRAAFARLAGDLLIFRAIDDKNANAVWEADYVQGKAGSLGPHALNSIITELEFHDYLRLTGPAEGIPIALLLNGMGFAKRMNLDTKILNAELGMRMAYPFIILMLVMLGASLGLRFRSKNPPGAFASYLSGPFLALMAVPVLSVVASSGKLLVMLVAEFLPNAFILSWGGVLVFATAVVVLLSARVAVNAPN